MYCIGFQLWARADFELVRDCSNFIGEFYQTLCGHDVFGGMSDEFLHVQVEFGIT